MAYIAVLQRDARTAARLTAALDDIHRVEVVESWEALRSLVSTRTVHACVLDADQPNREKAVEEIRSLGGASPALAIVAYGNLRGEAHELYRFGSLGVHGVVPADRTTDSTELQDAVDRALDATQAARLREALAGRLPELGVRALAWATEHGRHQPDVEALAAALGASERRCDGWTCPRPRAFWSGEGCSWPDPISAGTASPWRRRRTSWAIPRPTPWRAP